MAEKQFAQLIVVGGGPAGLMAAGQAASLGVDTVLLEKMEQPGQKLRITGKGRCNLTNVCSLEEFIQHFDRQGLFLRQAFARYFSQDLLNFMDSLNVKTQTERGGRVFPVSEDASDITQKLTHWAASQGARIQCRTVVKNLLVKDRIFQGVTTSDGTIIYAQAVILAAGGASFSHTGSSGDGFRMAAEIGHAVVPIRPALVPLKSSGDVCQRLQGLTLHNVEVRVLLDGKVKFKDFGEMLFTHFGVSGPVILSMSGKIVDALREKKKVEISIDLKPALDEAKLDARLLRDMDTHGKQYFRTLLDGLLPQKMVPVMADCCGIAPDKPCHQINAQERARLLQQLKDFRVEIKGHLPLDAAMVTAGGVSLKEVDPRTMQSRLVEGVYFAGEVLDLAADTGGYNLQAAFSTGWLAGNAAAQWLVALSTP
jgi:predicted Rossmann fold flavoprotein